MLSDVRIRYIAEQHMVQRYPYDFNALRGSASDQELVHCMAAIKEALQEQKESSI